MGKAVYLHILFCIHTKISYFCKKELAMSKQPEWNDNYWLMLMQIYLKKPTGVKPMYDPSMVKLALELHIHPRMLYGKMFQLRQLGSPSIQQIWEQYSKKPKKLSREVAELRKMRGFGKADTFYHGVELNESWEKDFKPVSADIAVMPIQLIMILDLYFRLTPITMVPDTPEIVELGKLIKLKPSDICEIMDVFKFCDPYLNHDDMLIHPLLLPCQEIWQRFGNDDPEKLAALAAQLKDYFK